MSAGSEVLIVSSAEFAAAAAERVARAIESAAATEGPSVALAGGATPRAVYAALAGLRGVPWDVVRVFFGDERAVGPDDPASNYRMAREALLERVPVAAGHVFRMEADQADRDAAAAEYEALLPVRLSVLILGVGRDGHTASLFPGSAALTETARLVVPAVGPDPPRDRLTITPPVIARARTTIVLASGGGKAAAVKAALEGPADPLACPARLARGGVWILDEDAAGALAGR